MLLPHSHKKEKDMASIFVEYVKTKDDVGYSEGPLNVKVRGHGYLQFEPKEEYGNRRVEELSTEDAAIELCERHRRQQLFRIAPDLIASQELANIESYISGRISPLIERIESLEEQVATMRVSAAKPSTKKRQAKV